MYASSRTSSTLGRLISHVRKVLIASQSWFVVSIVGRYPAPYVVRRKRPRRLIVLVVPGAGIGINAALISIVTEWLSDMKMGYCSDGWWLNQEFCCWELEIDEDGACDAWHLWSTVTVARWFIYVLFAVRLCNPNSTTS